MSKYIVIPGDGDPCPRCGEPTEIREHDILRDRQLRAPFYYSRWFRCMNPDCKTTLIMPPRFIVKREERVEWSEPAIPWQC
jgi:hypothetical protein